MAWRYSVSLILEACDRRGRSAPWLRIRPVRLGFLKVRLLHSPYVSLHWGITDLAWDLAGGCNVDGAKVKSFPPTSLKIS